jgi:phage gp36-like protein
MTIILVILCCIVAIYALMCKGGDVEDIMRKVYEDDERG